MAWVLITGLKEEEEQRDYDMRSTYTVAAVPLDVGSVRSGPAIPIKTKIPYTLKDAEEVSQKYNENPSYRTMLKNFKYSHFVPFNLEALTMEPPYYYIGNKHD